MDNFDLRKYLAEGQLTTNNKVVHENLEGDYAICHVEGEYGTPDGDIVDFEEYILIEIIDRGDLDVSDDSTYNLIEQGELSMDDQEYFNDWNSGEVEFDLKRYSVEEVIASFSTLDQAQSVFDEEYRDSKNTYS